MFKAFDSSRDKKEMTFAVTNEAETFTLGTISVSGKKITWIPNGGNVVNWGIEEMCDMVSLLCRIKEWHDK